MLFKKKNSDGCLRCGGTLKSEFSYCPYCGVSLIDKAKMSKDYGMLGKNDAIDEESHAINPLGGSMAEKLFSSVVNNLIKNIDKQIAKDMQNAAISPTPNGIKIVIGPQPGKKKSTHPQKSSTPKKISDEQLQRLTTLPKKEVKSQIKRLGDKIIYTLDMPGIVTPEDVFVSKLESGYEVKAIGEKKVFVSRLNVELPLKGIGIENENILLEFSQKE